MLDACERGSDDVAATVGSRGSTVRDQYEQDVTGVAIVSFKPLLDETFLSLLRYRICITPIPLRGRGGCVGSGQWIIFHRVHMSVSFNGESVNEFSVKEGHRGIDVSN